MPTKGEPTGKNCVRCGGSTVWKSSAASPSGLAPVCLKCKRTWAVSARGKASRRGANRSYRNTESGKRTIRNCNSLRRARKLLAECPKCHGSSYYDVQIDSDCYVCGDKATATDHIYPLAREGLHCNDNFAPICAPCNSSKTDKLWPGHSGWEEFVEKQKGKKG